MSRCGITWLYDTNEGCSIGFPLEGTENIDVLNSGDARYTRESVSTQLPPADINLSLLLSAPDCSPDILVENPQIVGPVPPTNDTPDTSTDNTNGPTFGLDVPPYKDLVLVSTIGFINGLDGLLLTTIKQTPTIRFEDGKATQDLSAWINGQGHEIGSWSTGSSGGVSFNFNGNEIDPTSAPAVASRSPDNFFNCYQKINTASSSFFNALSFRNFCFNRDGSFTTTSGLSSVSEIVVGGSNSSSSGTFQVDGNVIRLSFGDGSIEHHVFGAYEGSSGDIFALSISEAVYNLDRE